MSQELNAPAPENTPAAPAPAAPAAPTVPAAPAPAAPIAEPAPAPAAPAPVAEPEPAKPGELPEVDDPGLSLALEFVTGKGISLDDPAMQAARDGDFTLLEAKLAALGAKASGYEKFLGLAKQAYERHVAAVEKTNQEVQSIVHTVCGGEQGWQAVQTWAAQAATPQEKAQINEALAAGGVRARMAALYLKEAYGRAHAGGYKEPDRAISPDAGGGRGSDAKPLTAREYAAEVERLYQAAGGRDITQSPAYRDLQNRRLAAKRAGY